MIETDDFRSLTEAVAKQLVSVEYVRGSSVVSVPLLYPSGAGAVVKISQHGDRYFVSDLGYGYQEAEMLGALKSYSTHARGLADHYGVSFDNQAFFVAESGRDSLKAVVTIIANCSVEAASIAALKAAERKYADDTDILYERLIRVFPREKVAKNVHFVGSSSHDWPISALVSSGAVPTIFEPVTNHHASVVNASAKFHDLARLETPPHRVAVVKKLAEMDSYLNLLAQSATVISYDADNNSLIRLAA